MYFLYFSLFSIYLLLERPSPPRGPLEISGMTENSFTLSWQPSEFDGGAKIIEYIIEMKETKKKEYTIIGKTSAETAFISVKNVIKDCSYQFRIYSRNEIGTSDPYEPDDKVIVGRSISKYIFKNINQKKLEKLLNC